YLTELEQTLRPLLPMEAVNMVTTEVRGGNASIEISLKPSDQRSVDSRDLADDIRRQLEGRVPGAEIRVEAQSGLWILRRLFRTGDGTEAVEVELRGYDVDIADRIANDMMNRMRAVPGVASVRLGRGEG